MKKIAITFFNIFFLISIINAQSNFKSQRDSLEFEAAKTEIWSPIPKFVTPGKTASDAPSDAIILYNGKDLNAFQKQGGGPAGWKIDDDGAMTVVKGSGNIETKEGFGDCQFHLEFREPSVIKGSNQTRGNSGIWFMSNYEIQILDNYNNPTYVNGQVGGLYKQHIPLVTPIRKPGEWQTYDIVFTAPIFRDNGEVASPGRITAFLNGVLVLNNVTILGTVEWIGLPKYIAHPNKLPIILQDHGFDGGEVVSFKNIWIRPL